MHVKFSPAPSDAQQTVSDVARSDQNVKSEAPTPRENNYLALSYVELFNEAVVRIESLGIDKESLFFLKGENSIDQRFSDATAEQLNGLLEAYDRSSSCQHVISFGGRGGGFEVAMQVQYDLRSHAIENTGSVEGCPVGSHTTYLDATSLEGCDGTEYKALAEDVDVFKMSNPYWDLAYQNSIRHSKVMTFLITPEWAESEFCRQELNWSESNSDLNRVFVMYEGVEDTLKGREAVSAIRNSVNQQPPDKHRFVVMQNTNNAEIRNVAVQKIDPITAQPLRNKEGEEIQFKSLEFKYELSHEIVANIKAML